VTVAPNGAGLLVSGDLTHPAVLRLPPGPGPRDDDRLARVMMDEMNKKWGPLLMFDHGAWRTVNWILPPPEGSVLLKGHPNAAFIADGEKMNIVAAPLLELYQGTHVCTAQFNLVGQ
jgi:hypothetical protein